MILAIDPGPERSAWCMLDGDTVRVGHEANDAVQQFIRWRSVTIEMIASYGMPVGAEVFETCVWIGRFMSAAVRADRITRNMVKLHICHSPRANDATIRQALIDRWGGKARAIGTKKQPGPLYGVHGDCWAALAVAVTAAETTARYVFPIITKEPA